MPRPESEITGDGPVADLARALRELRARAGQPTYREMAGNAHASHSSLADATKGIRRPTWEVVQAFIRECGEEDDTDWLLLWEKARPQKGGGRAPSRRRTAPPPTEPGAVPHRLPAARRVTPAPDPWQARTAAGYIRQLRALRAWAGSPGVKDIARAGVELGLIYDPGESRWRGDLVPSSTVYDALNPKRTTLPQLKITQMIARACGADVNVWTAAWQDIAMRDFDAENPPLPSAETDESRTSQSAPRRNMRLVG
jgi:Helix-turn-helix domain